MWKGWLFLRWQKSLPIAGQVMNKRKKKMNPGWSRILKSKQDNLLKFVSGMRDTGIQVNSKMVQLGPSQLSCKFCEKSKYAKKDIVKRFLKTQGINYCIGTHESQKPPNKSQKLSLDFILKVCPIVNQNNCHQRYIHNCDQSGIFYTKHEKLNKTRELRLLQLT